MSARTGHTLGNDQQGCKTLLAHRHPLQVGVGHLQAMSFPGFTYRMFSGLPASQGISHSLHPDGRDIPRALGVWSTALCRHFPAFTFHAQYPKCSWLLTPRGSSFVPNLHREQTISHSDSPNVSLFMLCAVYFQISSALPTLKCNKHGVVWAAITYTSPTRFFPIRVECVDTSRRS